MVRFIIAAVAALTVALSLFLLMNTLISGEQRFDRSALGGQVVDFIRVRPDEIPETRERAPPEEPPPPEDPPPPKQINVVDESRPTPIPLNIELPNITVPASIAGGPYIDSWLPQGATTDGDVMPIVRIDPQWPREALLDRIEGWVKLEFTILPDGSVKDPVILDSEPGRLFDRSAMSAVLRWKFRPRIVAGEAVSRQAVQIIDFTLAE